MQRGADAPGKACVGTSCLIAVNGSAVKTSATALPDEWLDNSEASYGALHMRKFDQWLNKNSCEFIKAQNVSSRICFLSAAAEIADCSDSISLSVGLLDRQRM